MLFCRVPGEIRPETGYSLYIFRVILGLICFFLAGMLLILLHFSNFITVYALLVLGFICIFKPNYPLYFLALILPLFGNNPGGKYSLFFIDQLVMLMLLRWLIPVIWKKKPVLKRSYYGSWIWLFFFITLASLFPMRHELYNAWLQVGNPFWFVYRVFTAYAVDFYWSFRLVINLFLSILFYYYILSNVREEAHLKKLAIIAFFSFCICLFFGILDYPNILSLEFFRPVNPDIQRFGYNRLMSFFRHSGWFAEYVVLLAPFFIAPVILRKKRPSWLQLAGILFIVYSIIFSYQRAGWISFSASMIVLGIIAWKKLLEKLTVKKNLVIVLIVFIIVGVFLVFFLVSDTTSEWPLSQRIRNIAMAKDRTDIWDQALFLYQKKPHTGIGAGNYYYYHRSTFPPNHEYYNYDKVTSHSTYLHILVERGPFALPVFIMIIVLAFTRALRGLGRVKVASFNGILLAGALASLCGFMIYALAQYMFYIRIIALLSWFIIALTEVAAERTGGEVCPSRSVMCRIGISLVYVLVILMLFIHPTSRDLFFWNNLDKNGTNIIGAWRNPWNELKIRCEKEVLEAEFAVFHPDAAEKPVEVTMLINGQEAARRYSRDTGIHKIEAPVPANADQPLRIRFLTDRPFRPGEVFPNISDKKSYYCAVGKDVVCRDLGREGIGFGKWEGKYPRWRWTRAEKALCEFPAESESFKLKFLAANPDLSENPLKVEVNVRDSRGRIVSERTLSFHEIDEIKEVSFSAEEINGDNLRLEVITERLFSPLDFGGEDTRMLGIYMSDFIPGDSRKAR